MEQAMLIERLRECGLSEKEATVFLELVTGGPGKASDIAKRVTLSRMDAYNQLRRLADHGLVRATVEKPMRFVPLPIEDALQVLIAEREEGIQRIEAHKEYLKEHIKPADEGAPVVADATFRIHQDRRTIHSQIRKMVAEGRREVCIAATKRSIARYASTGLLDEIRRRAQADEGEGKGVEVRVLTQVADDNTDAVLEAVERGGFELRHSDRVGSNLVIVDETTILNSLVFDDAAGSKGKGDVAIWTDSSDFVRAQQSFFDEAWDESTPLPERVTELQTGRVVEPIKAYLGEGSMYEKFRTLVAQNPAGRPDVPPHLLKQGTSFSLRDFGIEIAHIFNLIGHRIGQEVAHDLHAATQKELWHELATLWGTEDFGRMERLPKKTFADHGVADEPGPVLRVAHSFSARGLSGLDRPVCSLDEGILAGIIETRLGRGCRVHEVRCAAVEGEACLFSVRFLDDEALRLLEAAKTAHGSVAGR